VRTLAVLRGRLVGRTIELVKDDPHAVQRFTVAHELGHCALEHSHSAGEWAETEANNYANELLVPGPLLREAMTDTTSFVALRRKFVVSRPVMEIACRHHHCFDSLTD
jgi:Zn-dependent peptidase ImmA (M78 family)